MVPESHKTPARHSCVTSHYVHSPFYDNGGFNLNGYIWENDIDDSLVVYGRVRELATLHYMHLYHTSCFELTDDGFDEGSLTVK